MASLDSELRQSASPRFARTGPARPNWQVAVWGPKSLLGRYLRVRMAWFGLLTVAALIFLAFSADLITPFDPSFQDLLAVLQPPSALHPFGTDDLGRDVLSRVVYGSQVSLEVGLISIGVALLGGVAIGLVAGYCGGSVDGVLMRLMDAILAFPPLVLALAITAALGMGIGNTMIAIGVVTMPLFARLVRSQALTIRELDYVTAARTIGAGPLRLMLQHIWPNTTAAIIVQASLSVSTAIITEAALSFLGVGVRPPTPSWGSMLNSGYQYLEQAPWLAIASGSAIFIAVLGLNFVGDGLRTALDPRLSQRGS
jgi:peptide/nickel transport system permease protein